MHAWGPKTDYLTALRCVDCTSGQANLCQFDQYFGNPGIDGACCTYKIVPEVQLCRLRPKISWPEAGLIQPLAIAIQMTRQAGLKAHQHVMILGGGCIGLMLGAMAKAYGTPPHRYSQFPSSLNLGSAIA